MTVPFRSPPQPRLRRGEVCGGTSQSSSRVGSVWALSVTISSVSMLTSSNDQTGGVLRHPRTPQMRPRVRRRRKGGWAALRASAWPSCGPSGPPAARSAVQHLRIVPALVWGGGRELYRYRTSAFSWSLSNRVPNSRSTRSAISCQVRPAAFISLRTSSAFTSDLSARPMGSGWRIPNALPRSSRNESWRAARLNEVTTGEGAVLGLRGRCQ